jgi:predicted TPR repeat methyltransferase
MSSGDLLLLKTEIVRLREHHQNDAEFLYWEAVLASREQRADDAYALLKRCLALEPDAAAPHFSMGKLCAVRGEFEQAAQHYEASLQGESDYAPAWYALGGVRLHQGQLSRAERAYSEAIRLGLGKPALLGLMQTLEASLRWQEALAMILPYQADAEMESHCIRIHVQFAPAEQTREYLLGILAAKPEHAQARHLLGGIDANATSERASDAYVRALFDGYASRYDEHMTQQMGYVVHQLMAQKFRSLVPAPARVLDLGCGTGLLGAELSGYHLIGVDLSQPMLDAAKKRGYQELIQAELAGFLEQADSHSVDAITAADTMIYFGPLEGFYSAAKRVLKSGGWLVFNSESDPQPKAGENFRQTPHGRYEHQPDYLKQAAIAAGFENVQIDSIMPRREAGKAMQGWLVSAQA